MNGTQTEEEYSIVLDIDPSTLTTAQEKGVRIVRLKNGRCIPTFFKKKRAVENEKVLVGLMKGEHPFGGSLLEDGSIPIAVRICYRFPFPKGTSKKVLAMGVAPMTQRPDVDNISKAVIDCMTKCGYWKDDSQIVHLLLEKYRCTSPSVIITIRKVLPK